MTIREQRQLWKTEKLKGIFKKTMEDLDLLRFTTAGSVDDGKSTLIGRLLYDSKSIFQDQLEAIETTSSNRGDDYLDLSLLTDGLRSEREQGITIDVAYRYFSTPKRKFIISDTPGHIEYTRNMITGASSANLAIILVDARKGLLEQTYRHSFIASIIGIKHIIVCVNKMDLVNYEETIFNNIVSSYKSFSSKLKINDIRFIPISALLGDNIVNKSVNMDWYKGGTLLYNLENLYIGSDQDYINSRFPVQIVIRPHKNGLQDYRSYAGKIAGGVFKIGDEVEVLPSGFRNKIKSIQIGDKEISKAYPSMSISMTFEEEIDISRGNMIIKPNNRPETSQEIDILVCWMSKKPLVEGRKVIIKHTTMTCLSIIKELKYKININTLNKVPNISQI